MATLHELAALHTTLSDAEVDHLSRLVASWSLLSDLGFSDMLLMSACDNPATPGADDLVVLGQVRPNNRSTVVVDDLVATTPPASAWPLVRETLATGSRHQGTITVDDVDETVPIWCVPVRFESRLIAVLVRIQGPLRGPASLYERAYLSLFDRLCTMVSDATFPFREADVAGEGMPRVGDGIVVIDGRGLVEFATPNATNAMHRLGIYAATEGRSLRDVGLRVRVIERALEYGMPALEEVDRGHEVAILLSCVPLIADGATTGVLILMRDVSDVRRLNRQLLNKEAAIREVHHRVKNNLQTISSLLRLQARRSEDADSRKALLEAERRIRSIAVVHEVLSREPGEEVVFDEIVRSIVSMVEDQVLSLHPVEIVVNGDLGTLATDIATPLAVVLAELLTNAVEHAFVGFGGPGNDDVGIVTLTLQRDLDRAIATVRDNGAGLPEGFSLDVPTSLGLSIVRDLVRAQMGGTIVMENAPSATGGGTVVRVEVPTQLRR